jgi:predicted transcriptional regulator
MITMATKKDNKTIAEKEKETLAKIQRKMKDPRLLVDTIKEVQNNGVAGEEDTILAEIIVATTRLVENAIPESTNLLLSDKTGLGKDHTTKKTLEVIIPEEDLCHVTKMSPEAFTYWHYKDLEWEWNYKVIHFEDVTQALLNCSTFKTMASGENYAVVVKDQKTIEIPIFGKPCMILTSHHVNPKDEALRRFRIGGLNDSKTQTRNVMDKISQKYTGRNKKEINYILRSAVQSLEPKEVIIPYAEIIQHFFPDDDIMRTHYQCFLNYICASAVFHQYQREKTPDEKIIATPDDYMIARMVLIYTTSNPKMIPLSKEYRDVLKILEENEELTVKELEPKCPFSLPWLYKHLPNLVATGLVEKGSRYDERANKDVTIYRFADFSAKMIPTWNELSNQIYNIVYKTNKTNKTEVFQRIEEWFSTVDIKPIKPKCKKEEFSLVFYGRIIPLYREVFSVFSVFYAFLRERDEKRYKKYYEEPELPEEPEPILEKNKTKIPDQAEDVKKLYTFVKLDSENYFAWDDDLKSFIKNELDKVDPDAWINKQIENGVLEEPVLGKLRFLYDFGGIDQ